MKALARACLRLCTLGIPLIIAACYGAPIDYERGDTGWLKAKKTGKVVDSKTSDGLPDIRLDCVDASGAKLATTVSAAADAGVVGSFEFEADLACEKVVGTDPAAHYKNAETSFTPETITLSMEKVN